MLFGYFNKKTVNLLREMVVSDFKIRYQGSVLGYLWSLVRPLALFAILYIVFAKFFKFGSGTPNFAIYLLLGVMIWTFFVEATNNGMFSITDRGDMIRKVRIKKSIIIVSSIISALINLIINLCVVLFFGLITSMDVDFSKLYLLPVVLIQLVILSTAISFFLATLYAKYRDVKYIWELAQQVLFYATPILYPMTLIPDRYQWILALSPLTQIIQDARRILVTPETITSWDLLDGWAQFTPIFITAFLSILAIYYFRNKSKTLAEEL